MNNATGVVEVVSEKPFTQRNGNQITLHSFKIQGDNRWFRTGTDRPDIKEGQTVKFVYQTNGNNNNVNTGSIEVDATAPVQQVSKPTGRRSAAGRDDYWAKKEEYDKEVTQPRISYAAAQKNAVALVVAALENDCLSLGSKKGDKLDLLVGYVDEVTATLALKLDSGHEILEKLKEGATAAPAEEEFDYGDEDGLDE